MSVNSRIRVAAAFSALLTIYIYSAPVAAAVETEAITQQIEAAFDAYAATTCTDLEFVFKGAPSPLTYQMPGAVTVFFGDTTNWKYRELAYYVTASTNQPDGKLSWASIGLNSINWWWSTDAEEGKIDIQTMLIRLIPQALGYYAGFDPSKKSVPVLVGKVDRDLTEQQKLGARALYFKDTGDSCTEPDLPPDCATEVAPDAGVSDPDGGTPDGGSADAGEQPEVTYLCVYRDPSDAEAPFHWANRPIDVYVYIPEDGKLPGGSGQTPGVDGGVARDGGPTAADAGADAGPGGGGDGGCCRLGHSRAHDLGAVLLLLLGVMAHMGRRRRG